MERDRTDKRILALLEANARLSAAAVGREIGLSRTAVQDRIARMEADGTIAGYRVVLSGTAQASLIRAMIFLEIAERPCDRALRWLAGLEGVVAVHSLAGETDAVALVSLASAADLGRLNDRIGASPMIARARSQIILSSR